ncbi:Glycosyltransferase Family 15 protein [Gigaspora rosea]|uniref:Glycosyltransferase Family 15 protein n=1 Tax=Gigaspora rosea TaxID=44941 RepID=A0A397VUS7_9GLOM|nr:Glycosyltransferase Family 15 protein [Gigaspora rosea]
MALYVLFYIVSKTYLKFDAPDINNDLQENNVKTGQIGKANACFVILSENSRLEGVRSTMRQIEDRFNHKYNYPYVFLNDVPFSQEFINFTKAMTKAKTEYGLVPKEHWSFPNHIDIELVNKNMQEMANNGIPFGSSLSYRHMCRFYSGFFYQHELMKNFDYYWRIEPVVEYYCDIDFDPFIYMKENDIKYGFTLVPHEWLSTIPTLWSTVKEFMRMYPSSIENDSLIEFITDDKGDYNTSEAYTKFFNFLDKKGGFFYERWGDAPVHTIAATLFLKKHQVRFFEEIGYRHGGLANCPKENKLQYKYLCNPDNSLGEFTYRGPKSEK